MTPLFPSFPSVRQDNAFGSRGLITQICCRNFIRLNHLLYLRHECTLLVVKLFCGTYKNIALNRIEMDRCKFVNRSKRYILLAHIFFSVTMNRLIRVFGRNRWDRPWNLSACRYLKILFPSILLLANSECLVRPVVAVTVVALRHGLRPSKIDDFWVYLHFNWVSWESIFEGVSLSKR